MKNSKKSKSQKQSSVRNFVVLALIKRSHAGSGAHKKSERKTERNIKRFLKDCI